MPPKAAKPVTAPTRTSARTAAAAVKRPHSDEEEEEELVDTKKSAPKKKAAVAKKPTAKKAKKAPVSEDEEEEEEEKPKKKAPAKKVPAKKAKAKAAPKSKAKVEDESDGGEAMDEDAAEEEEEAKPKKKAPASKVKAKAKAVSEDEVDDEEEEEEQPAPKKRAADIKKAAPKSKGKTKVAADDDMDVDDAPPAPKMVTVIKRGAAPVDERSGKIDSHQVYTADSEIYDAMLNQTDITGTTNSNKFYVLQLLHPIGSESSMILYTRWGRVGEPGKNQEKGPFAPSTAIVEFKKQFKAKAGVNWEDRIGMVPKKGKYVFLERAYDDDESEGDKTNDKDESSKAVAKAPPSSLDAEVQALCKLIFSTALLDAALSSMNYDAAKLPLGKLAKSTVLSGFAALKRIAEVLESEEGDEVEENGSLRQACAALSSNYYSIIPHVFGRARPTVIDTVVLLKKELELVDALGEMEIAQNLIQESILTDSNGQPINPIDAHFRMLKLESMKPVKSNSAEFLELANYARDSTGHTHSMDAKVMHAFRVERPGETAAWESAGHGSCKNGERLLLWHGSRSTNYAGILKQGLRIAPPEAPVTGYMFGKGVYFADCFSKSANYCYASSSNNIGVLLLCEVAAAPFYEQYEANYSASEQCGQENKRSTLGLGRTRPAAWQDAGKALSNPVLKGVHIPKGKPVKTSDPNQGYLEYNEYIVYDTSQIRVRYLLMVKM